MKPLKPVMAALLAASSVAFALPRISYATTPNADVSSNDAEKNSVNELTALIAQKPEALADIGERLARFVSGKDASGRQYMTAGLLKDEVNLPGALKMAKAWPELNKATPDKIAVLYFVIGPDDAGLPAWAQTALLSKVLKPNMTWNGRLAEVLASRQWTDAKQIPQTGAADATTAFLGDAAEQAQKILDDPRTKKEIQLDIAANDATAVTMPTDGSKANPMDTTGAGYDRSDLYEKGAEVGNIFGPKDDGYRTLSMKVITVKDADGNMINKLGVTDITDIKNMNMPLPLTQLVDVSHKGDTDIVMRDGGRHYTVTVGDDGNITLKRAGAKDGDGGGSMKASKAQLTADRNAQIAGSGTVMVGGMPFYVLGQGGPKGSLLFFSKAQMDSSPTVNAHPELMGDVAQVIGDGSTAPITGKPDLGTLPDGSAWHLEFDLQTRLWKVAKGAGDQPKDGKGKKGKGGSGDSSGGKAPEGGSGGSADDATTLDDVIALAKQDKADKKQVWSEDEEANKGFDDATFAKVRIMSNQQDDGKHFNVLFDPSLNVPHNTFEFAAKSNGVALVGVRGWGNYVVVDQTGQTIYYEPSEFPKNQAGTFSASTSLMQNVTDVDIMEQILTSSLGVKPDDPMIAKVRARVKLHVKGEDNYTLDGGTKTLVLTTGDVARQVWPDDKPAGDQSGNAGLTGLRGPGTVISFSGGGDEGFPSSYSAGSGRTAARVDMKSDGVALYSVEDDDDNGKTAKVYYVMVEYNNMQKLASRTKPMPVFGGQGRLALPSGYKMQGFKGKELPDTAALAALSEENFTQERGAIVAYRTVVPDATGVRNPVQNCAGPVIWWGMTKADAQKACESEGH